MIHIQTKSGHLFDKIYCMVLMRQCYVKFQGKWTEENGDDTGDDNLN